MVTRFSLPVTADKRTRKGLKKQIISIFSIVIDEGGPQVESIASPYPTESFFNDLEISVLFTAVTTLDIHEMYMGELKLIFETRDDKMKDGRPSKKVNVAVCGSEANSEQVREIVINLINSSETAIKNLKSLIKK